MQGEMAYKSLFQSGYSANFTLKRLIFASFYIQLDQSNEKHFVIFLLFESSLRNTN